MRVQKFDRDRNMFELVKLKMVKSKEPVKIVKIDKQFKMKSTKYPSQNEN